MGNCECYQPGPLGLDKFCKEQPDDLEPIDICDYEENQKTKEKIKEASKSKAKGLKNKRKTPLNNNHNRDTAALTKESPNKLNESY